MYSAFVRTALYRPPDPLARADPVRSALRSNRYLDSTFEWPQDSGTVALVAHRIESPWGDYRWRATAVDSASISFEPLGRVMGAPSLRQSRQHPLRW